MVYYPDPEGREAHARHYALLAEAEQWRLANMGCPPRVSVVRRGARLAGRALVRLGASLMRYGRAESAVILDSPSSARSIALN